MTSADPLGNGLRKTGQIQGTTAVQRELVLVGPEHQMSVFVGTAPEACDGATSSGRAHDSA